MGHRSRCRPRTHQVTGSGAHKKMSMKSARSRIERTTLTQECADQRMSESLCTDQGANRTAKSSTEQHLMVSGGRVRVKAMDQGLRLVACVAVWLVSLVINPPLLTYTNM